MKHFTIRNSDKDRRKSLQPRSFPLLRRKYRKIISKEERVEHERRAVRLELT